MKLLILSDIHGNLNALNAVLEKAGSFAPDAVALLGDIIDYGMRSDEVISVLKHCPYPVVCNIRGNHESAVIEQAYERFSSERGKASARHTRESLGTGSWEYISEKMSSGGKYEFIVGDKRFLAVHGSLCDEYWKSIFMDSDLDGYEKYDYVLSGHSHLPHYFEKYFVTDNPRTRNKKKTVFINPGSVGQPRNLNNHAQFAILDTATEEIVLSKVEYDIGDEQKYFDGSVDEFYKNRLKDGI